MVSVTSKTSQCHQYVSDSNSCVRLGTKPWSADESDDHHHFQHAEKKTDLLRDMKRENGVLAMILCYALLYTGLQY